MQSKAFSIGFKLNSKYIPPTSVKCRCFMVLETLSAKIILLTVTNRFRLLPSANILYIFQFNNELEVMFYYNYLLEPSFFEIAP